MTLTIVVLVCTLLTSLGLAAEPALETDEEKMLYTMGIALSRNLSSLQFTADEIRVITAGLTDGVLGREPRVSPQEWVGKIDPMLQGRMQGIMAKEMEAGAAFLAQATEEAGAEKTDSGMVYLEMKPGDGASPAATDQVKLHYHGTLRDGTVFDSSREGEPVTFAVGQVIACFGEGLQRMKVGGTSKLTCPSELAYGERGSPPKIGPGATIRFEVELLEIVAAGAPAESPTP